MRTRVERRSRRRTVVLLAAAVAALALSDLARAIQQRLLADHPGSAPDPKTFGKVLIGYEAERQAALLPAQTQEALAALGYDVGEIDGLIGAQTRRAIQTFQNAQGLPADGRPSPQLLERMQRVAREKGALRPEVAAPQGG